jgi:outer membrane lipoprotein-sorting protein
MSFEYLFSDYVYAKLQKTVRNGDEIENKNISIVFNSGGISKDSLHFLYLSLRDNEILDADEIWIYSYMQTEEEEDTEYETVIDDLKTNLLPDDKKFEFNPLPRVDYKTYADELRED